METQAMTATTDVDFIRRQLTYAQTATHACRATVTNAEVGMDYEWKLAKLVKAETEMVLYNRALEKGPEAAATLALHLISSAIGGSSSTDAFDNEIARCKAGAAYEVIRILSTCGLSHERLGEMIAMGR